MFYLDTTQKYFSRLLRNLWNNSYTLIRMNIKDSMPEYPIIFYTRITAFRLP